MSRVAITPSTSCAVGFLSLVCLLPLGQAGGACEPIPHAGPGVEPNQSGYPLADHRLGLVLSLDRPRQLVSRYIVTSKLCTTKRAEKCAECAVDKHFGFMIGRCQNGTFQELVRPSLRLSDPSKN